MFIIATRARYTRRIGHSISSSHRVACLANTSDNCFTHHPTTTRTAHLTHSLVVLITCHIHIHDHLSHSHSHSFLFDCCFSFCHFTFLTLLFRRRSHAHTRSHTRSHALRHRHTHSTVAVPVRARRHRCVTHRDVAARFVHTRPRVHFPFVTITLAGFLRIHVSDVSSVQVMYVNDQY
jgi:hypothetical protein